jgi:hypothetical protein
VKEASYLELDNDGLPPAEHQFEDHAISQTVLKAVCDAARKHFASGCQPVLYWDDEPCKSAQLTV